MTGEKDLCGERELRYQEREFNGTKVNGGTSKVAAGTGRATVTHHHGMASTSSMDGWAEQFFCAGESKVTPFSEKWSRSCRSTRYITC